MTGGEPGPVMYTPGRATPGPPVGPADLTACDPRWAVMVEERLTGIEDNTYDLADQVRALAWRVTVALVTAIAAIAALVTAAIVYRE